jgi:hypothetical protein
MDAQFARVHTRITTEIAELKSQLRVEIEATRGGVRTVYDFVVAQDRRNVQNAEHDGFRAQLENHEARIDALEPKPRA